MGLGHTSLDSDEGTGEEGDRLRSILVILRLDGVVDVGCFDVFKMGVGVLVALTGGAAVAALGGVVANDTMSA